MRDTCNNFKISRFPIWVLCIGVSLSAAHGVKADCVPNQSEVPACLSGTAISPDYSGAVIQENGQPGLRQIVPGDMVDAWTVDKIGTRYVVLKRGTQTVRLELPQALGASEEAPPPDDPPTARMIKRGPVRHTRSLARGGE
jgi:hypothetical protein